MQRSGPALAQIRTGCTLHPDLCTLCLRWLSPIATYGGGVSPLDVGTTTPLAPAVVSPITTCAGGVFLSTYWRRYRTYTRATCTVWWYIIGAPILFSEIGFCMASFSYGFMFVYIYKHHTTSASCRYCTLQVQVRLL